MRSIIIDIETGPISRPLLDLSMPEFSAPANFKDPEKITAAVEAKKQEWLGGAALSAITGRVLAIGINYSKGTKILHNDQDEAELLRQFWALLECCQDSVIGFNIEHFDVPFLMRRSMRHGIRPAMEVYRGRYLSGRFIDLMTIWKCGDYRESISLNNLAKFLGVGEKAGNGSEFAQLWATDRPTALSYLEHDLNLTKACAQKMGVIL